MPSRKHDPMHLGIFSYNVEYGARPDELAHAGEERGFESFWVGEHTHISASRCPGPTITSRKCCARQLPRQFDGASYGVSCMPLTASP